MSVTRATLAELLAEKIGLNGREAREIVEAFFKEIQIALQRGEGVKLHGFGQFEVLVKGERPGRNPKTGEPVPVSARRVVTFQASRKLKLLASRSQGVDSE